MTKIDIVSGFLGAGKTTLIKKLLKEAFSGEQIVLIENEFGEIGIDGGFLQEAGVEIREMNSGCICCSLVGDFGASLKEVLTKYQPDRIIIEPSGVGKLSDVKKAVADVNEEVGVTLNSSVVVVDAQKCRMYMKNFGEFFNNQIENSNTIVLSRTDKMSEEKIAQVVAMIREHNPQAEIITTPWDSLDGAQILEAMENRKEDLAASLLKEVEEHHHHHHDDAEETCCCGHHHHHHDHEEDEEEHEHHHHDHEEDGEEHAHHHDHDEEEETCGCGHHHHDHDEEEDSEAHAHHHHHHEHDEECDCGHDHDHEAHEHHHHHEDGEECTCGHHHHGHHHHHADEVFTSWGLDNARAYDKTELEQIIEQLADTEDYGIILRAKGMVASKEAGADWLYFDLVPGEYEVRTGKAQTTGKICVIGSKLAEDKLAELFA